MRYLIYFILFILAFLTLIFSSHNTMRSIATSLVAGSLFIFIDALILHWKYIHLLGWSIRYRNQRVRLSIAYLFRIKINNQYLLVKSKRRKTFQPPGGVYKRLPSSSQFFNDIGVTEDNYVPCDNSSEDDLRIQIKGKYLLKFFLWLEDRASGRETSPWREFYEELISTNILSSKHFPYIQYQLIRQEQSRIKFSKTSDCYELRVADIYELLPDKDQQEELNKLKNNTSDQYMWADEETIRHQGVIPQKSLDITIGDHAIWVV